MKLALLFLITLCSVFAQSDSAAIQLAQKERDFSLSSATRGIKNSFLAYFDDSCVAFYPRPVNAKHSLMGEPESRASLAWSPTYVEISASGDFGYTTGPSEYRAGGIADSSMSYGHFISVWQKNGDGDWKVILDVGSSYPKEKIKAEQFAVKQLSSRHARKIRSAEVEYSGMRAADRALSLLIEARGSAVAMKQFASEDVRVYRKGAFPSKGITDGLDLIKNEKPIHLKFYDGRTSSAADLGFTYGIVVDAASDTSTYIRIWRKENEWKVAADIMKSWPRVK